MNELFVIIGAVVVFVLFCVIFNNVVSNWKYKKLRRLKETGIVHDAVIEKYGAQSIRNNSVEVTLMHAVCSYVDKNSEKRIVRSQPFSPNDPVNNPDEFDVRVYVNPSNPKKYAVEFIPKAPITN